MSDLIDRQAAIEVIDAVFPVDPMKSEYAQGIACGAALAKTYVEQLPSAQPDVPDIDDGDMISRQAATDAADEIIARDESGNNDVVKALRAWKAYIKALPPAKKEITLEDVEAYCEPRCLQIVTMDVMMPQFQEEKEIKRLRELAARILGKYEEEKKKQLAAVRLASLRGTERDRAKELQARAVREIENLRKEIKG